VSPVYSPELLRHWRKPQNFGELPDADGVAEDLNPLCGDRIRIEVKLRGDVVETLRFRGDACAIAVASASVLSELVRDRAPEAVGEGAILAELGAEIPPVRMQCLRLPIQTLKKALAQAGAVKHGA
jgi:nitrogen fixation NifU-like protein